MSQEITDFEKGILTVIADQCERSHATIKLLTPPLHQYGTSLPKEPENRLIYEDLCRRNFIGLVGGTVAYRAIITHEGMKALGRPVSLLGWEEIT